MYMYLSIFSCVCISRVSMQPVVRNDPDNYNKWYTIYRQKRATDVANINNRLIKSWTYCILIFYLLLFSFFFVVYCFVFRLFVFSGEFCVFKFYCCCYCCSVCEGNSIQLYFSSQHRSIILWGFLDVRSSTNLFFASILSFSELKQKGCRSRDVSTSFLSNGATVFMTILRTLDQVYSEFLRVIQINISRSQSLCTFIKLFKTVIMKPLSKILPCSIKTSFLKSLFFSTWVPKSYRSSRK